MKFIMTEEQKNRVIEQKKILIEECEIYIEKIKEIPGGQHCGIVTHPTVLYHADLNIKISVGYHRSNHRNKQMALELFELALFEIIK